MWTSAMITLLFNLIWLSVVELQSSVSILLISPQNRNIQMDISEIQCNW